MLKAELFEEIRSLLREPQAATVSQPWLYGDMDLVVQIRSAMRHLRLLGVSTLTDITLDATGDFSDEIEEADGVLIAMRVASRLLTGDLLRKLADGELGAYFKSGPDIIDTKVAAQAFVSKARVYDSDFGRLLAIRLAAVTGDLNASANVFGNQSVVADGET